MRKFKLEFKIYDKFILIHSGVIEIDATCYLHAKQKLDIIIEEGGLSNDEWYTVNQL